MNFKKHLLRTTSILGIGVGLCEAAWATLLAVGVNSSNFIIAFLVMMIFTAFSVPVMLRFTHKKLGKPRKIAVIIGLLYGTGNLILMSIINSGNLVELYSFLYISTVVFVVFQILYHRTNIRARTAIKFIIGAVVSVFGLTGLLLSSNSLNLSFLSGYGLLTCIVLILLYGAATFLFSLEGEKTKNIGNSAFWIIIPEILLGIILLPFGHTGHINFFLIAVIGILLGIFANAQFIGYDLSRYGGKKEMTYSIIETILINSDIILLSLIYIVFIGHISLYQALSLALIFLGVFYVSKLEV